MSYKPITIHYFLMNINREPRISAFTKVCPPITSLFYLHAPGAHQRPGHYGSNHSTSGFPLTRPAPLILRVQGWAGPVDALNTPNCQVHVRQSVPCVANFFGLKEADLSVSKQEIAAALPAPPSIVFAVIYG